MSRSLALFGIGLVFGAAGGFLAAASQGVTLDGHDHSDPTHHDAGSASGHEDHAPIILAAGENAPVLSIEAIADPVSGWNLHLVTKRFRFAPENAGRENRPGEGHAHVYVNGIKLARLYGPWMHLSNLPSGEVDLRVTLNANDHSPLVVGDELLSRSVSITVD